MIEEIIPGNKTRLNIIKAVYENPQINLTNLIKKVKASPNLVLKYVNKLSLYKIVKEEKSGGKKKVHVRNLRANFDNETARVIYSLVEMDKKTLFLEKYKKLKPYFLELMDINKKGFVLVYGSYARFAGSKDSDLDILIVGKLKKEEIKRIQEIFITLENELSLKIETVNHFLKNKDKPLYQNILKEHVIIYGILDFMKIADRCIRR